MEKGAYTGAQQSRMGRFERAHGGTLLLYEIVELTPRAQANLLRVLQEGELERVGDSQTRSVDVRVIGAARCYGVHWAKCLRSCASAGYDPACTSLQAEEVA